MITVATVRQTNSTITVTISSVPVEAMLDSGSTITLLREGMLASVAANTQSLPHVAQTCYCIRTASQSSKLCRVNSMLESSRGFLQICCCSRVDHTCHIRNRFSLTS